MGFYLAPVKLTGGLNFINAVNVLRAVLQKIVGHCKRNEKKMTQSGHKISQGNGTKSLKA